VIRFAGQRALLLDAVAMGLLAQVPGGKLWAHRAADGADPVWFAHGWRMAEALRADFKWDSDEDWRQAAHPASTRSGGLFRVEPANGSPFRRMG